MLLKIRATLPLLAVIAYFVVRLPTQASAHPAEIVAAFILVPALIAWGVTGLEKVIREAQSTMDTILSDELDGGPETEPMLITHDFHPVSQPSSQECAAMLKAFDREYPRLGGRHERTEVIPAVTE